MKARALKCVFCTKEFVLGIKIVDLDTGTFLIGPLHERCVRELKELLEPKEETDDAS